MDPTSLEAVMNRSLLQIDEGLGLSLGNGNIFNTKEEISFDDSLLLSLPLATESNSGGYMGPSDISSERALSSAPRNVGAPLDAIETNVSKREDSYSLAACKSSRRMLTNSPTALIMKKPKAGGNRHGTMNTVVGSDSKATVLPPNTMKTASTKMEEQLAHSASGLVEIEPKAKHVCFQCGKVFKRAHNLKIHGRLHSGDKPYACPFPNCSKDFRWKSSIVSHINWHKTKRGDVLPGEPGVTSVTDLIRKARNTSIVEFPLPPLSAVTKPSLVFSLQTSEGAKQDTNARPSMLDPFNPPSDNVFPAYIGETVMFEKATAEVTTGCDIANACDVITSDGRGCFEDPDDEDNAFSPSTTCASDLTNSPLVLDIGELGPMMFPSGDIQGQLSADLNAKLDTRLPPSSTTLLPSIALCNYECTADPFSFLDD